MSSKDVADAIRRITAVRDGQVVTVGYEQKGMSYRAEDDPYLARPDIAGRTGKGVLTASASGVAGPLTEEDATSREYYPERLITSSDGLFTLVVRPIKVLHLTDRNGAPVDVVLAEPQNERTPP